MFFSYTTKSASAANPDMLGNIPCLTDLNLRAEIFVSECETLSFNAESYCSSPNINDISTPLISDKSGTNDIFEMNMGDTLSIGQQPTSLRVSQPSSSLNPCALSFSPLENRNVSATESSDAHCEGQNGIGPKSVLHLLKANNADRPVIAQLNINFLAPKFEPLEDLIKDNIDLLLISETKIDDTYQTEQFRIEGYSKPIRLDRNRNGGGLMIFSRDDLSCHEIKTHELPTNVECKFLEMRIRQSKWLIVGGYNPHKDNISYFLEHVGRELDKNLSKYENLLLLGDWNSAVTEREMNEFCDSYGLENLIKVPTCYKSTENPSSIDIMLTNKK